MKVLLLTKYDMQGASSRIRALQYIPRMKEHGIDVDVFPLFNSQYLNELYILKKRFPFKTFLCYINRFKEIFKFKQYDVIWLQKEIFPWLPYVFDSLAMPSNIPIVMDIDDAIFHNYDMHPNPFVKRLLGKKISALMKRASIITAGNEYIADYARRADVAKIEIIPSAVELNKYPIKKKVDKTFNIGWVGTPLTVKYLEPICELLNNEGNELDLQVTIVGASLNSKYNYEILSLPWEESSEGDEISKFDVGVMPLVDEPFERGKCGYKLIQYMACGLPVIASPVGVNRIIIHEGVNGFFASTPKEWLHSLFLLKDNIQLRKEMGKHSRAIVEVNYNADVIAAKLIDLFVSLEP